MMAYRAMGQLTRAPGKGTETAGPEAGVAPLQHAGSSRPGRCVAFPLALLGVAFGSSQPAFAEPQCVESLTYLKTVVDKALADHTIDEIVYEDQQKRIAKIQSLCSAGNEQQANAMLFASFFALSLESDEAHERAVNKH